MKARVCRRSIIGLIVVLVFPLLAALALGFYGRSAYQRAASKWEAVGGRTTPLPKDYWPFTEADYQLCLDLIKVDGGIELEEREGDWDCISKPWDCENPHPVRKRVQPMLDMLLLHGDRILCDELDEVAMDRWLYQEELHEKVLMPSCKGIGKSSLGEYLLFNAYLALKDGKYEEAERSLEVFASLYRVKVIEAKFGASFTQVFLDKKYHSFARHALTIAGDNRPKLMTWLRAHSLRWDARKSILAETNSTIDLFKAVDRIEEATLFSRVSDWILERNTLSSRFYAWVFVDFMLTRQIKQALQQLNDLEKPFPEIRHKLPPSDEKKEDAFEDELIDYVGLFLVGHPPIPYGSFNAYHESRARNLMLQTALDLLDHKDAHGSFPQRLDTPPDPFNGQPLGYALEGKGFVLQSVGGPRCGPMEWRWEPQP